MVAGIKHFTQWKKMAIVTDQKAVEKFTDLFSYVSPGEAKGFELSELQEAIDWVSQNLIRVKRKTRPMNTPRKDYHQQKATWGSRR